LGAPLQSIVADRGRRLHGRLDIAGLDEPPLLLRMMCPHTGEGPTIESLGAAPPAGHTLDLCWPDDPAAYWMEC
jgi:hypothetical protein